ncbi:exodeoxyribonuclease VII large subunit [Halalkalibacter wakoensis JCM 9140]|uniref:Exodeoxyribonuclease 7 large subunit n=1 Tax=Halalkalibacter wakoensis JCM 9140 TaxID=1236970 RepID=W4PXM5_9BACI|nr:exodeoxyribonuclease VII large subunit [Halalkalibacter wakoensis]GAE24606.1 exodeoxyribonuclease VII large subunit [Halalkalibacter wakoensis JCM 9140]
MATKNVLTISEVTRYIKSLMEEDVMLQSVWIRGELSNVKMHSRGHLYFTVKDDQSRMQAVMFAGHNRYLKFKPENGMKVLIRGEVNVYEPYGQYQFYAKEMQPDGLGSLYLAYEKLKAQLEEEGLFAPERKKAIPSFPARIAVITSPTGAAIRDIIITLKRRYPMAQVTLLPVLVQGEQAPSSITRAIKQADLAGCFDCLIVGRGGGSIEELWAFNDEEVVRAISDAHVPIISAVGHETDFTISDFVADLRAPTPTGAAELAVPDQQEVRRSLSMLKVRLKKLMKDHVAAESAKLERLKRSYAFRYPEQLIQQKEQQLDGFLDRLKRGILQTVTEPAKQLKHIDKTLQMLHPQVRVQKATEETKQLQTALIKAMKEQVKSKRIPFEKSISELHLLSPLRLMDRGYSLIYDQNTDSLIKSTKQVQVGSKVDIRLKDGNVHCVVEKTDNG